MAPDPAALDAWSTRFAEVAAAMDASLAGAARSPNIRARDRACALFDTAGRLVAEATPVAVHAGAMSPTVRAAIARAPMGDGDVVIANDPWAGGTRLADVTLVAALDVDAVRFYLAVRARHADVGGREPGSIVVGLRARAGELPEAPSDEIAVGRRYRGDRDGGPVELTIDDEGARLAPALLTDELAASFAARSRTPAERAGDLVAQRAALAVGRRALAELCARHGAREVAARADELRARAAGTMRAALAAIPDGVYAFADSLDDDGAGTEDVAVRVRITVAGDEATVDFGDCDDESPGMLNAPYAVTLAAVADCFRQLCPAGTPANEGLGEPVRVIAPAGSIVNARPPRAVAGSVETAARVVDVVLGALAQGLPDRIAAASCGTLSNLLVGGVVDGQPFAWYETLPGGAGGGPSAAGAHALLTPAIAAAAPEAPTAATRVIAHRARPGSGGVGLHDGGDGLERVIEFLAPATVTLVGERRRRPPYGLAGGGPGSCGEDLLERDGRTVRLPAKCTFEAQPGDRLTIRTPGGGAWGDPRRKGAGLSD